VDPQCEVTRPGRLSNNQVRLRRQAMWNSSDSVREFQVSVEGWRTMMGGSHFIVIKGMDGMLLGPQIAATMPQ
jgi:hypothetical protein